MGPITAISTPVSLLVDQLSTGFSAAPAVVGHATVNELITGGAGGGASVVVVALEGALELGLALVLALVLGTAVVLGADCDGFADGGAAEVTIGVALSLGVAVMLSAATPPVALGPADDDSDDPVVETATAGKPEPFTGAAVSRFIW